MSTQDIDNANNARDDADFEALMQGRGELAELLRAMPQPAPSPELDALIVAHAESALNGKTESGAPAANDPGPGQSAKRPVTFVARWRVPLGLAASLMLGLPLAMMYQSNPELFDTAEIHAPSAPSAAPAIAPRAAATAAPPAGAAAVSPSAPDAAFVPSPVPSPAPSSHPADTTVAAKPAAETRSAATVQAPPQLAKMKEAAKAADTAMPAQADRDRAIAASGAGAPVVANDSLPPLQAAAPASEGNSQARLRAMPPSPAPEKNDALAARSQAAKQQKASPKVLAEENGASRARTEANDSPALADASGATRVRSEIMRPAAPAASGNISGYASERAAEPQPQIAGLAAREAARRKEAFDTAAPPPPPPPTVTAIAPQADFPESRASRAPMQASDSRQAAASAAPAPAAAASGAALRSTPGAPVQARPNAFPGETDAAHAPQEKAARWLAKIEKLMLDDKRKEALEEWKKFRKAHPEYLVSTALRERMAELEKRAE